eukprot:Hpha_TRINITY_DN27778_c0_g1::TRINITY_DN27778_c0_g1_i1::g.157023::m.157023
MSHNPFDPHSCARRGDYDNLRRLLIKSPTEASSRETGLTPLHSAVEGRSLSCVQLLLHHKADPNATESGERSEKRTPLHIAAKHYDAEIVRVLLDHGADPTRKTKAGETVLHQAARDGNRALLETVIQAASQGSEFDFNIDCINERDETPLFLAAGSSSREAVNLLLDNNANPHLPNREGKTPLVLAQGWAKGSEKAKIEKHARERPKVDFVTLEATGQCIRKDLLPEDFDEVKVHLSEVKKKELVRGDGMREGPREGTAVRDGYDCSFGAQLSTLNPRTQQEEVVRAEAAVVEKGKKDRWTRERDRVDDRLRGLFYADLRATRKKLAASRRQTAADDQALVARTRPSRGAAEERLDRLATEVRALKNAGFKDPTKEERKARRRDLRQKKNVEAESRLDWGEGRG